MTLQKRFRASLAICVAMARHAQEANNESATYKPMNVEKLSEATGISVSYLENLICPLRLAGLVTGVRGPGGGYALLVKPEALTVGAIQDAIGSYGQVSDGDFMPSKDVGSLIVDLDRRLADAVRELPLLAA